MPSVSNTHKVIHGISSQTLVTIVLGVVEIVSFSIMSRLLTKQDFGYYAAISVVVAIFSCFSDAGIGSSIVQRKDLTQKFINNAFTLSLIFGGVTSLLLLGSSPFLAGAIVDKSMTTPLMLMSATLLLNCLTSVNTSQMFRKLQFLQAGLISLFSLVTTTCVAVFLAWRGYGYYAIITKAVLASVISLVLSHAMIKPHYRLDFHKETCKQILGFSGWLMASGLFRNLAHDVDKLLMSHLLSVVSLGAYNRPKEFIGQISGKLNGIFDAALFPVLSSIQDDRTKIKSAFRRSLYFMNIFSMLLTLAFAFNSELLIRIFFGEQWLELKWITVVLSFLTLFNIDGRLADCFLRSLAMTKQQFFFRIIEAVAMFIGVILGAQWDIMGVALGVVLTNALMKITKILYISYKIEMPLYKTMLEIGTSWKFTIILIPLCLISTWFFSGSITGNVISLIAFITLTIIIFLVVPSLVGETYKQEGYLVVRAKVKYLMGRLCKKEDN